jgi:hypothetical protein
MTGLVSPQRGASRRPVFSNFNLTTLMAPLLQLAVCVLVIVSVWKVFTKAGQPGWASIIPIYNLYILMKIAGRPGWWLLLLLIPLVNLVIVVILSIDVAKAFGKGAGFGIGLLLLGFIFYPILAFGDATYASTGSAPAAA